MRNASTSLVLLVSLLALAGCNPDPIVTDDTGVDAPSTADAPAAVDAPATEDAPATVDAALPNCDAPGDYVDGGADPAVTITGFTYTPPCLTIAVGDTVSIEAADFHPLVRSTMGTAGNPIPENVTVTTDVTFPAAGFYPYYCGNHGSESGGMAGVIQVVAP